jgi:hypothetical protein
MQEVPKNERYHPILGYALIILRFFIYGVAQSRYSIGHTVP